MFLSICNQWNSSVKLLLKSWLKLCKKFVLQSKLKNCMSNKTLVVHTPSLFVFLSISLFVSFSLCSINCSSNIIWLIFVCLFFIMFLCLSNHLSWMSCSLLFIHIINFECNLFYFLAYFLFLSYLCNNSIISICLSAKCKWKPADNFRLVTLFNFLPIVKQIP